MKGILLPLLLLLYAPAHPLNTLGKLKDGQQLFIFFRRSGCFGEDKKKLVIAKRGANWFATLTYTTASIGQNRHLDYKQVVTPEKQLSADDIRLFGRFENELNHGSEGYCTTVDIYTFSSAYGTFTKTDGSGQWNGFYHLTDAWFGIKE